MTDTSQWIQLVSDSDATWVGSIETTVALTIVATPTGDVTTTWRIKPSSITSDSFDEPSVEVTVGWKDAQAIASGELHPAVAYMQGRLKPSGDMAAVLVLLERTALPEFDSWVRTLRP